MDEFRFVIKMRTPSEARFDRKAARDLLADILSKIEICVAPKDVMPDDIDEMELEFINFAITD